MRVSSAGACPDMFYARKGAFMDYFCDWNRQAGRGACASDRPEFPPSSGIAGAGLGAVSVLRRFGEAGVSGKGQSSSAQGAGSRGKFLSAPGLLPAGADIAGAAL